ncbi:hypothetical protein EYZ11_011866 [Aspergillus tanneri]|uniref:Uncharacterized protein n=1 Tax=Aspergillus tanneri TaxID=1220188 RepID=A0A4S3J1S2_9EURO|nr:hypothetical protein EYZ11_011866 [Aspergillus tanneri]
MLFGRVAFASRRKIPPQGVERYAPGAAELLWRERQGKQARGEQVRSPSSEPFEKCGYSGNYAMTH